MNPSQSKPSGISVSDIFSKSTKPLEESKELAYLVDYEEEALEFLENGDKYQGIQTGYSTVDKLLGSFLPGELFTLAGDTGHGKSILAMNIAQNVYRMYQKPVLFVNMELTRNQAVQRFYNLSGKAHDYKGILTQKTNELNYKDVDKLMLEARDMGVSLVVIDHLHFFDESIGDNAPSALTRVVKHFKQCAVTYNIPVLLLCHVTPKTDMNGALIKPDLHTLKGSRSIEQLSDMVGFVYRDSNKPTEIEFYMKKQRSRPLIPDVVNLHQQGWRLLDWVPEEKDIYETETKSNPPTTQELGL